MSDVDYALKKLKELQIDINQALKDYFVTNARPDFALSSDGNTAYEMLREFSERPGKRLRGSLAIIAYEMFGGQNRQAALQLAVAIELIQNYLLIVDDVMDRSETRRGKPTIHQQYLSKLKKDFQNSEAEHISNMLAVNVGILGQHLAAELLAQVSETPQRVLAATEIFHKNISATGYGQIDDLLNTSYQKGDEATILNIYSLKSSYYTFINPLQTGAALAGADTKTLLLLRDFGLKAGVAFQLHDDILGLFGDTAKSGKSNLDDLREGKNTLLIAYTLAHASAADVAIMKAGWGNTHINQTQFTQIQQIVEACSARQYVQEKAQVYMDDANKVLIDTDWDADNVRFLRGILEFSVTRES